MSAFWCLLDLGIPPEPESDPVSQLHEREEAETQAQAHQTSDLKAICFISRNCDKFPPYLWYEVNRGHPGLSTI